MTIERKARPPRDGQPQETRTSTRGKPCSTICCKRKEAAACSHASRYWVSTCCSMTTPPKSERLNSDFLPRDAQQQRTTSTIYKPNRTHIKKNTAHRQALNTLAYPPSRMSTLACVPTPFSEYPLTSHI